MERDVAVSVLKACHLVSRQRMTALTTLILQLRTVGKEAADIALCLVSKHMTQPVSLGLRVLVHPYLHAVTTMEHRLHRTQLAVDTCIDSMKSHFGMYVEGKIQSRGVLWQFDTITVGRKRYDVVIIERRLHIFQIVIIVGMESDVLKHLLEVLQPFHDVLVRTLSRTTETVITNHALRRYVHLLPLATHIEQLHVEASVSVILWSVDIVYNGIRHLLEILGQQAVYLHADLLLLLRTLRFINNADIMLAVNMIEVAALGLHLAPYTVRRTHTQLYTNLHPIGVQYLLRLGDEGVHGRLFRLLQICQELLQLLVFGWTAIT